MIFWLKFTQEGYFRPLFKIFETFEISLSDDDKLILTAMKSGSFKGSPKERFADVIITL